MVVGRILLASSLQPPGRLGWECAGAQLYGVEYVASRMVVSSVAVGPWIQIPGWKVISKMGAHPARQARDDHRRSDGAAENLGGGDIQMEH